MEVSESPRSAGLALVYLPNGFPIWHPHFVLESLAPVCVAFASKTSIIQARRALSLRRNPAQAPRAWVRGWMRGRPRLSSPRVNSSIVEAADGAEGPGKATVLETLGDARTVLAVQVLFGDANAEETLDALAPLWNWLQENRRGLLQADGEGYYDVDGLILELE